MKFLKVDSSAPVINYVSDTLNEHLEKGEKVLWIVTGGSSIPTSVAISHKLNEGKLQNLTVLLTDERFVSPDNLISNWAQLKKTGFELPGAAVKPILNGKDVEETTNDFDHALKETLNSVDFKFGIFGIGADGHTAGILPGSPALKATEFAAHYQGPDYNRVTMTIPAITTLDEVVVYMTGEAKHPVLDQLDQQIELTKQPSQALKQIPKLTIYNDYKGDLQ